MKIVGTVVAVDKNVDIEKKAGGTYPGTRLTFRTKDGKIQEQNWHENGLKYNHAVRNSLDELNPGEIFTMEKEKNEGGFWEVKKLIKGEETGDTPTKSEGTTYNKPASGGNWPTTEERKQTQTHIIRQNCVTNAVNFVNSTFTKKDQTVGSVLSVAKQFETFVLTGDTGDINGLVSDDLDSGIE